MLICDAQVHAPDTPTAAPIAGMTPEALLREMDGAGVDRVVVVPMVPPGDDPSASNPAARRMAAARLDRFGVMAPLGLTRPEAAARVAVWRSEPGMLGLRLAFLRDPNRALLAAGELEWLWSAAEAAGVPVMLLAPGLAAGVGRVAERHPGLRLVLDHLNLHPMVEYDDLVEAVRPIILLAGHDNLAVKASALPCWARDAYPHPSLRDPIARVVEAFGPRRVFWGSDLTRLACTYAESVRLFTEELPFLGEEDKRWIMGRGVTEWLRWDERAGQAPGRPSST